MCKALTDAGTDLASAAIAAETALFGSGPPSTAAIEQAGLDAFEGLATAGIDVANALAQGLLVMLDDMVDQFDSLRGTPIDEGFINTIYGWIAELAGQQQPAGGWAPTISDIVTLAAAFPATIIFKLLNDNQAPFPQPTAVTDAAADFDTDDVISVIDDILCGIATLFTVWGDFVTDEDEGMEWLEVLNNILLALTIALAYPDLFFKHATTAEWGITTGGATQAGLALYIGYWVAKSYESAADQAAAWNAVKTFATTLIGAARLTAAIYFTIAKNEKGSAAAGDIVGNIGGATDFLRLPPIWVEPVPAIKAAIDFASGVGGAVCGIAAVEESA